MLSVLDVRRRSRRLGASTKAAAAAACWSWPHLLLALVTIVAMMAGVAEGSGCKVEHCTRQFQQAAMASGVRRGPSPAFCIILRQYSDCLRSTARSCRGHLAYHSTITLVQNWNGDFNCSYVKTTSAVPPPPPPAAGSEASGSAVVAVTSSSTRTSLEPTANVYRPDKPISNHQHHVVASGGGGGGGGSTACTYQGRPEVTHCSFYGDPHLVTFNGDFQTCKVAGAWPLIDNAYLAVSVTNEAVVPGSAATATTKITIIIKGGSDCAPERTYEATVDSVPASFVDGSQWGGPVPAGSVPTSFSASASLEQLVPVRIIDKEPGRHVEIHAKHLGAILVVRQVGRYLTFSARLPRDIAEQGAGREGLQLCVKGCPASERIDVAAVLLGNGHGHGRHSSMTSSGRFHRSQTSDTAKLSLPTSTKGMHRDAALALCREYNLIDYYLDSCMFDLMTTGDPSFSLAASHAQSDYLTLLPDAAQRLTNRTWPLNSSTHSSTASHHHQGSLSSSASSSFVGQVHGPGRPFSTMVVCLLFVLIGSCFTLSR